MYDLKTWLAPNIEPFKGHSGPHAFHIKRNISNDVTFKWKKWSSTNEEWKPDGDGIRIFKVCNVYFS